MIFANLSEKLQNAVRRLRQKGKLTEKDIDAALREVRLALLEADVNFKVVKTFIADVRERCLQSDVMASLTPGQTVIKIVKEELTNLMGGKVAKLSAADRPPTVVMLVVCRFGGNFCSQACQFTEKAKPFCSVGSG